MTSSGPTAHAPHQASCRRAPAAIGALSLVALALVSPLLNDAALAAPRMPPAVRRSSPTPAAPETREGATVLVNGRAQQARWRWIGAESAPSQVWLPLEVLQNQLGVSSRSLSDGTLDLEWFGRPLKVPPDQQQALDDEVAIDALPLLQAVGVGLGADDGRLRLDLPVTTLVGVRSSTQVGIRRVVLDLSGPALVETGAGELLLGIRGDAARLRELQGLGLAARSDSRGLALRTGGAAPSRVFTLGEPSRVVIDLPAGAPATAPAAPAPIDPRLQALLGRGVRWDRMGRDGMRINAVRVEPANGPLQLVPLVRPGGMTGLGTLTQLAQQNQALVAINGGYFNRVRRLPLGALKRDGRWLSGPILNRGVAAWSGRELPRFGRLSLEEWVAGSDGRRLPLVVVNSGFVQRGISRYTPDWGHAYQALSGNETALLLRNDTVVQQFAAPDLERGVPLRQGDTLLVGRGGTVMPWSQGERLTLSSRPSSPLGEAQQVIGGGPLLLEGGRTVLNGSAESFAASFMTQGAPRTVLASDGREVWLITLEGDGTPGPTLTQTAQILLQLGLRDALNLDGGSSTGLVMGGSLQVKGRGVVGSVHNGVGLVP
ncbi:phosphodiester glycosidase family protein [Cyanobium sp. ATX 6A2]|uniref:phosphodiester glycosidase family protein n=1 Tax=Cyanobium sp. ATX 6A2 TaxID=2823700 RepID=UPI0020CF0690|nr:phosphodiester glycosidase family protein [Cyanobium sp. ATX 6A2]MCP9889150.1 phosphodiester glycosidase family protein [Cyanobium sp. ATX 6A2]